MNVTPREKGSLAAFAGGWGVPPEPQPGQHMQVHTPSATCECEAGELLDRLACVPPRGVSSLCPVEGREPSSITPQGLCTCDPLSGTPQPPQLPTHFQNLKPIRTLLNPLRSQPHQGASAPSPRTWCPHAPHPMPCPAQWVRLCCHGTRLGSSACRPAG